MSHKAEIRAKGIARREALKQAIAQKSDAYASQSRTRAETLAQIRGLDKTQVRGLETLAYTTDKVSDVFDWLKVRVGRDEKRSKWAKEGIGREVLTVLEGLRDDARSIAAQVKKAYPLPNEDPDLERQVHLRLIREYLKHLAAHFEYAKAEGRR
jgi:cell division protein FtsB